MIAAVTNHVVADDWCNCSAFEDQQLVGMVIDWEQHLTCRTHAKSGYCDGPINIKSCTSSLM